MMISSSTALMASPAFAGAGGFNFGDYVTPADLGFFRKISRGLRRTAKRAGRLAKRAGRSGARIYRRVTPRAARRLASRGFRVARRAGRFVVELHLLPFKLMMKLAVRIARILCRAPRLVVVSAYSAAVPGANPSTTRRTMDVFCTAVRTKRKKLIKRLLPKVLKIAAKVAAAGAVPGLGPALAVAENIPGMRKYLSGVDTAPAGMTDQTVMEDMDDLSTLLGAQAVSIEDLDDEEMADALGVAWDRETAVNAVLLTGLVALGGYALYSTARAG